MSIDAALTRPTERCDVMFNGSSPPEPSILQGILMPQSLGSSAHFMPRHRFEPTADPCLGDGSVMNRAVLTKLERRLGRHCTQNCNFLHIENWCSVHSVIRTTLKLMGLYWRGRKNSEQIPVRHNRISMKTLPSLRWLHSIAYQRPTRGHERRRDATAD